MKYVKTYESQWDNDKVYTLSPYLVKLHHKISDIVKDIDPSYSIILSKESPESWAGVKFYSPLHKSTVAGELLPTLLVDRSSDRNARFILCDEFETDDELLKNLFNYIKHILNMSEYEHDIPYLQIDGLIEKLDGFELWLNMKKYNL